MKFLLVQYYLSLAIGAHSKFFSEEAFNKASEPKELYVVDDAEHIDLYDKIDKIPFDKLELFFKNNLK